MLLNSTTLLGILPLVLGGSFFAYVLGTIIYRLYFHPLAKYPGPWLAKISDIYCAYYNVTGQLHVETEKGHLRYGPVFRQGPNKLVFNSSTAVNELYHSRNVQKSVGYTTMVPEPGAYNIFTAVDKGIHGHKRKVLNQGFSDQCIRSFEPTILEHVDIFVRNLLEKPAADQKSGWSTPVDMTLACRYLGYDIMGEFGFGQTFHLQTDEKNHFLIDAVTATSRKAGVYVLYPELQKLQLEKLFYKQGLVMRQKYLDLMSYLVKSRKEAEDAKINRPDLLTFLVDAKNPDTGIGFTENEMWAESRFLLIAGADTSTTCLTSIFFYLTAYPSAYAKLAHEVRSTFSDLSEIRSGTALNSCRYLRACIDEALRMSPPISGTLWREASTKSGIIIDGEVVPPGVDVGVSPYASHHNEATYPDHGEFKPERWLPEEYGLDAKEASVESSGPGDNEFSRARYGFSPFSLGPRACAGRTMAYTELSDTVARTIFALDFRRAEGPLGAVGAGKEGLEGGRGRVGEFQLREHLTCTHDGPYLQFRARDQGI